LPGLFTLMTVFRVMTGKSYKRGNELDTDGLNAILELAAWAHAEWVRIHPFANGNGRTARLWANSIMLRYSLPPVVRLRPRPNGGYGDAAGRSMKGEWEPTNHSLSRNVAELPEWLLITISTSSSGTGCTIAELCSTRLATTSASRTTGGVHLA